MKRIIASALLCVLSGCTQSRFPPEISGSAVLINTPQVIAEISHDE
ncbi:MULTISPECIES: hypothetical protein [Arsenophonus]